MHRYLDERPGLLVLLGDDDLPRSRGGRVGVGGEFALQLGLEDLGEEGTLGVRVTA